MIRLALLLLVACGSPVAPRRPPPPRASEVIYFVLVDRFANGDRRNDLAVAPGPGTYHGGDLAGLRAKLPDLRRLGVDVVWISPVVDNVDRPAFGAGFPDWGYHGYWAGDFTRIDEHLGSEADLVALVDDAHRLGLRVILDVVLNHPGYGARWEHDPAWTRTPARGDCGRDPVTECLYGLPDFRTEDPRVADALIGWHLDWLRRSGADGVRIDAARHVGEDVLARFAQAVRRQNPRALILAEHWGTEPGNAAAGRALAVADAVFDFGFADHALAFVTGRGDGAALGRYLEARGQADRFVPFLGTHDTPGFLHRAGGDRRALLLGLTLLVTVPGMPLLYYGDEVGRAGGEWPANRSDMPWSAAEGADLALRAQVTRLLAARRGLGGGLRVVHAEGPVVAFTRGETALVVINAGQTAARVPLPAGVWNERLGWGAEISAGATSVPARSAALLRRR